MPSALVIGGTGMLSGAVNRLSARGWTLGIVARRGGAFASSMPGAVGKNANWDNTPQFLEAVCDLIYEIKPVDTVIVWTHDRPRGLALEIAKIAAAQPPRRFFHIMGSAVSNPSNAGALEKAKAAFDEVLPVGVWRPIRLGFVDKETDSRWLTNAEISSGLLTAIDEDLTQQVIGQTEPWSRKPS